jgi:hypothetical protein
LRHIRRRGALALQLSSQVNRPRAVPEQSRDGRSTIQTRSTTVWFHLIADRAGRTGLGGGSINYSEADALDFLPDVAEIPPRCTGSRFTFHFANCAVSVGTSLAVNE